MVCVETVSEVRGWYKAEAIKVKLVGSSEKSPVFQLLAYTLAPFPKIFFPGSNLSSALYWLVKYVMNSPRQIFGQCINSLLPQRPHVKVERGSDDKKPHKYKGELEPRICEPRGQVRQHICHGLTGRSTVGHNEEPHNNSSARYSPDSAADPHPKPINLHVLLSEMPKVPSNQRAPGDLCKARRSCARVR